MRIWALFVFLGSFCLLGTAQNPLSVPFLDNAPLVDGDLGEWPFLPTASFSINAQPLPFRTHTDIWLGFDESNLYGAFLVQDSRLVQTEKGNGNPRLFLNDAVEIYLDAKNDSQDFMDANDFQLILDAFGQVVIFRGGDKYQLKINGSKVPKDTITDSFVGDYKTILHGTVNKNEDTDSGYTVEFRIPWASVGIQPRSGYSFKMDFCLDDLDTLVNFHNLPINTSISQISFQSINGTSNFGFPKNWQTVTLHGQPSGWHRLKNLPNWPFITLGLLTVLLPMLVWLGIRNRKLRHAPAQAQTSLQLDSAFSPVSSPTTALPHEPLFLRAREVVLQHLDRSIPPAELAAHLFIGLRQLQRIFKEELHTTPNAFIISIKMEEAARRLTAGESSMAELAYALGFTDPAYFARIFKKHFNCSPTAFVEQKMNPKL